MTYSDAAKDVAPPGHAANISVRAKSSPLYSSCGDYHSGRGKGDPEGERLRQPTGVADGGMNVLSRNPSALSPSGPPRTKPSPRDWAPLGAPLSLQLSQGLDEASRERGLPARMDN